jgi:hypothetical protein
MTQQLSTLVGAGIPMVEALNALIDQTENGKLKLVLTDVREKVNEGIPLARAMKEHSRIFDELYTSMVAAGEQSGALEIVLQRLSEFTDAMVRLKGKVLSAMLYPLLMGSVSVCVLLGMFIFVIPRVKRIFDSFGATLPLATRITLGISDFFVHYWYLVILFVVAVAYGFRRWVRTPEGPLQVAPVPAPRADHREGQPARRRVAVLSHAVDAPRLRRADPHGDDDREGRRAERRARQGDRGRRHEHRRRAVDRPARSAKRRSSLPS